MKQAKTVWAYTLYGHNDGSYMLGEETYEPEHQSGEWRFGVVGRPHPATCTACGVKVDVLYVGPEYRVKKRRRDITATYDGYILVSERLRRVLQEGGAASEDFIALPADPDFYWLRPQKTLEYSAAERAKRCPACEQFFDEVAPIPVFAGKLVEPIAAGVYRSSIEFGSAPLKAFQVVIGLRAALAIKANSLVGVDLAEVLGG